VIVAYWPRCAYLASPCPPVAEMPPKHIFKSLTFAISGKLSQPKKDYEELITKHGGDVASSVTSAVNFLVSTEADVGSQKVAAALKKDIPVIQEGFVGACVAAKKLLDPNFFAVKGAKKKRAASKGVAKAAPAKRSKAGPVATCSEIGVINKSGLVEKAAVVVENKKVFDEATLAWDVELVLNDPSKARDRFYNLQLLKSKTGNQFWVVQHWGRTGLEGAVNVVDSGDDVSSAKRVFRSKYRQKTGNAWGQIGTFVETPGKYKLLAKVTKSEAQGLWQYYLHNEVDGKRIGWYNYTGDSAKNMEKFWHQFEENAGLEVRFVQSDYFKYEVNFSTMVQTNLKSGMRRVIRRVAPGKKPSPEAPSVIPEKAKPAAPAPESSEEEDEEEDVDDEGDEEEEPDEAVAEEEGAEGGADAEDGPGASGSGAEAADDAPEAEAETVPALDEDMGVGDTAAADSEAAPTATGRAAAAAAPAEAADDVETEEDKPAGGRAAAAAAAPAGRAASAASTGRAATSTEAADDADTEEDTTLPLAGAKKRGS